MQAIISSQQFLIGVGLAVFSGAAAWRAGALAPSGALAAAVLGSFIFGLGGLPWAALMLAFFISSSALSKVFAGRKSRLAEKFEKGSRRDWAQVFANGGLGIFLVFVQLLYPEALWPWLAYAGAIATVNGDTWATELGVLSPTPPRLIATWKPVEPGTSGGVSPAGSAATLAGAGLIAAIAAGFTPGGSGWALAGAVALGGLAGAFTDSLLGATVQAIYYDPARKKETERRVLDPHGRPAAPVRGWPWMNNDAVNFLSALTGALAAAGLWALFS